MDNDIELWRNWDGKSRIILMHHGVVVFQRRLNEETQWESHSIHDNAISLSCCIFRLHEENARLRAELEKKGKADEVEHSAQG